MIPPARERVLCVFGGDVAVYDVAPNPTPPATMGETEESDPPPTSGAAAVPYTLAPASADSAGVAVRSVLAECDVKCAAFNSTGEVLAIGLEDGRAFLCEWRDATDDDLHLEPVAELERAHAGRRHRRRVLPGRPIPTHRLERERRRERRSERLRSDPRADPVGRRDASEDRPPPVDAKKSRRRPNRRANTLGVVPPRRVRTHRRVGSNPRVRGPEHRRRGPRDPVGRRGRRRGGGRGDGGASRRGGASRGSPSRARRSAPTGRSRSGTPRAASRSWTWRRSRCERGIRSRT
jgi:hypothetical protein